MSVPRVFRQHLAGRIAVAGDDVEDAVGNAGLARQFGHADRCARSEFGRLQHHRAAAADRPWHALGCDDEGEVPGRDDADDADRLAQHQAEAVVADIVVASGPPALAPGRPHRTRDRRRNRFRRAPGQSACRPRGFRSAQSLRAVRGSAPHAEHQPRAFGTRHAWPWPGVEGPAGRAIAAFTSSADASGHAPTTAPVARAYPIDCLAGGCIDRLAIDKHPVAGLLYKRGSWSSGAINVLAMFIIHPGFCPLLPLHHRVWLRMLYGTVW